MSGFHYLRLEILEPLFGDALALTDLMRDAAGFDDSVSSVAE
jgi:hypothetical protein